MVQEGVLDEQAELLKCEYEQKQKSLNRLRDAEDLKVKTREKIIQDFVDWCKESLKPLEISVDKTDLIRLLLDVPLSDRETESKTVK